MKTFSMNTDEALALQLHIYFCKITELDEPKVFFILQFLEYLLTLDMHCTRYKEHNVQNVI